MSDIHAEFGYLDLPQHGYEDQQILILAGDIGLATKDWTYLPFIEEVSERFQDVIYIMGNHEFYGTSVLRGLDKIKSRILFELNAPNVHVVNNEVIRIHDVSFICSTLWTSYDNQNALCMYNSELYMNDHKKIRTGTKVEPYLRKFMPRDAVLLFLENKRFIFDNIKIEKEKVQKVVVVTHQAPSVLSIADQYKTGPYASLNGAYASSLEEEIMDSEPDIMIHGHTHHSFDYELGKTRIICNPRGYAGHEENPNFNPLLTIEI